MLKYLERRILWLIPVLLGVTLLIFTIMYFAPGDAARMILGDNATPEAVAALTEELGLNDPFLVQYGRYMYNLVFKLDMGISYHSKTPVIDALIQRYPTTLLLASLSTVFMIIIGIPLGCIAALKQNSVWDRICSFFGIVGVSMPSFWLGLIMIMVFTLKLGWFPASGFFGPKYWIMPAFTIGFTVAAGLMRMTRSSMLEVIRQDYIRTARAKGQTEAKIVWHHMIRNAMIPILTNVGLQFGILLAGSMITETIFAIPGIGKYLIDSVNARDFPAAQGSVLLISASYCIVNLFVDLIYAYIDPRIKSQYQGKSKSRQKKEAVI